MLLYMDLFPWFKFPCWVIPAHCSSITKPWGVVLHSRRLLWFLGSPCDPPVHYNQGRGIKMALAVGSWTSRAASRGAITKKDVRQLAAVWMCSGHGRGNLKVKCLCAAVVHSSDFENESCGFYFHLKQKKVLVLLPCRVAGRTFGNPAGLFPSSSPILSLMLILSCRIIHLQPESWFRLKAFW